ncbi:hypothetical protein AX17_005638 [Amanita inopinata Kibby_2008]|nr:hypothetical protein AX17_005638 [Amanita inopinata Kibby_2008]
MYGTRAAESEAKLQKALSKAASANKTNPIPLPPTYIVVTLGAVLFFIATADDEETEAKIPDVNLVLFQIPFASSVRLQGTL